MGYDSVMIPYFEQPRLDLGPVVLYAFGILVASGFLLGVRIFERRAAEVGLDPERSVRLVGWVAIPGFLGAHLVDRLFYSWEETLSRPLSLLAVWEGISSFGGLFGALLGAWWFFRREGLGKRAWVYLDALAYALPPAWLLGRLGCFLAYDHVGTPTDVVWGQEYRDGIVRHNLGLEEAFVWALLVPVMMFLGRRKRTPGTFLGALFVLYAPARFLLDFLRIEDERYFGLIVSQYGATALFFVGVWALWRAGTGRTEPADEGGR